MKYDKYTPNYSITKLSLYKSCILEIRLNCVWELFDSIQKLSSTNEHGYLNNLYNKKKLNTNKARTIHIIFNLTKRFISLYNIFKASKYIYHTKINIDKNLCKTKSKWLLRIRFRFKNIINNMNHEKENKYG